MYTVYCARIVYENGNKYNLCIFGTLTVQKETYCNNLTVYTLVSKLNWIQFMDGFFFLSIICYVLTHLLHIHMHSMAIVFFRTIYWEKYHPWSSECGLLLPVSRLTILVDYYYTHNTHWDIETLNLHSSRSKYVITKFKYNLCIEMGKTYNNIKCLLPSMAYK